MVKQMQHNFAWLSKYPTPPVTQAKGAASGGQGYQENMTASRAKASCKFCPSQMLRKEPALQELRDAWIWKVVTVPVTVILTESRVSQEMNLWACLWAMGFS